MNIDELVCDLKEHLDTYCQTYDDYDMTYNQTEMIYYLIKNLEKENKKYKDVINKAINELERGIEFCKNDSQELYNSCNIAIRREERILKILKEVEHEKSND